MITLQPISDATRRATDVLVKELGVVDTIRFLSQFRARAGNYTMERQRLFEGMSVKDNVGEIKEQRKENV